MVNKIKITVVGSGYVGMSLSVLLAQHNDVTVLDIDTERVDKINKKQIIEFNSIGENGWELVQILPRSKEDKFHVDLAMWKRRKLI